MTMDWGDTVALLLLISPLIIVLLALVIGAIALLLQRVPGFSPAS